MSGHRLGMGRQREHGGPDFPLYGFDEADHGLKLFSVHGRVADAYSRGEIELHADALVRFRQGELRQLVAIFRRVAQGAIHVDELPAVETCDACVDELGPRYDFVEKPVLVSVVQLVQNDEGVEVYAAATDDHVVPSLVRLSIFDGITKPFADERDVKLPFLRPVIGIGVDGKLSAALIEGSAGLFLDRSSEDEVVEGAAKVVEHIADDEGETRWRRLTDDETHDVLSAVGVAVGPSVIRLSFDPLASLAVEGLQVQPRLVQLGVNSAQVVVAK